MYATQGFNPRLEYLLLTREPRLGQAERHHLKPNVLLLGPSGVGKTHLIQPIP